MDKKRATVITVTIVLAVIAIVFGYMGYPVNGTNDAVAFVAPAINFALHHELTSPVTRKTDAITDPSGQWRLLFYPPLFPMAISLFISPSPFDSGPKGPGEPHIPLSYPRQAFLALGIMNALALFLTSLIFYKVATMHNKKLSWFAVAFIVAASLITVRVSWGFGGRPEILARLFVAAGLLLMLYAKRRATRIEILALLLGLMAATHPGGTVLFALVVGMFFSLEYRSRDALRDTAFTYLLGGLAFLLVMQVSPFGIYETFSGIAREAIGNTAALGGGSSGAHLLRVLVSDFKSPYRILYFLMMVLVLIFCITIYRKRLRDIASPLLFACFSVAFAGLMAYFANDSRNSYVTLFFVLALAALLYYVIHISGMRTVQYGTLAVMLFLAAASAQPIVIFPFFIKNGVSMDAARNAFEKISRASPAAIYIPSSHAWTLSENYNAMDTLGDFGPNDALPPRAMILWGQTQDDYYALAAPPDVRGCPLIESNFVGKIPEAFGIRLAPATPSYAFAAYACP